MAHADEDKKLGWKDTAEFSVVATSGNAESTSLGFKNTATREQKRSTATIRLVAFRVETASFNRVAVGGEVQETKIKDVTTENYYAGGRYERRFGAAEKKVQGFWYGGASWYRNRPSGIDARYIGEGGIGHTWRDKDTQTLKSTYGLTVNRQEDVNPAPGVDETFAGLRGAVDYLQKFGKNKNTTYTNVTVLDYNFSDSEAWRVTMDNGLAVSMTEMLALKAGLLFIYQNRPPIDLIANDIPPPLFLPYELEKLDTIFTVSLVVDFK